MHIIEGFLAWILAHWISILIVASGGLVLGSGCVYSLKRRRSLKKLERLSPVSPQKTGRETLADEPDIWSFRPRPGLRDSQNEPVVEPPPLFIPQKPNGFLSSLWANAMQDPLFEAEPFFSLSRVLHHETHSLYQQITDRSTWSPAERSCLRTLVLRAHTPGESEDRAARYFTCPSDSTAPDIVERCDAWALVNGLMNMQGKQNPVVTSLRVNMRVGRCIFGSMELGLAKMQAQRKGRSACLSPKSSDVEVRRQEVDAWLAVRQQSNFTLARFRLACSEGESVSLLRSVVEMQQDQEALWELNRRRGNSFTVFTEAMRRIYDETDARVMAELAERRGRPASDFRFYPGRHRDEDTHFEPGRAVTYQVIASPGENVPRKKEGAKSLVELVEVAPGDVVWRDLPEEEIRPLYLEAFYAACDAERFYPGSTPEIFSERMGQYFGERLAIEILEEAG